MTKDLESKLLEAISLLADADRASYPANDPRKEEVQTRIREALAGLRSLHLSEHGPSERKLMDPYTTDALRQTVTALNALVRILSSNKAGGALYAPAPKDIEEIEGAATNINKAIEGAGGSTK